MLALMFTMRDTAFKDKPYMNIILPKQGLILPDISSNVFTKFAHVVL